MTRCFALPAFGLTFALFALASSPAIQRDESEGSEKGVTSLNAILAPHRIKASSMEFMQV
jgi:hypothetical protein